MAKIKSGAYTGKWYDERNEKRREQYHTDADYREAANKSARSGYRQAKGVAEPFDPRKNLHLLPTAGKLRSYEGKEFEGVKVSYSKAELATIFDRPTKQIQQWAADGRISPTIHRAKDVGRERNWIDVYTLAEAKAIIDALGPFLSDLIYFRCDHVDAITAVHEAVDKVRST